jgi:4'-phosphopantetheinyl transferase
VVGLASVLEERTLLSAPSGIARCELWWARPADQHEGLFSLLEDVELWRRSRYRRPEDRARFTVGATLLRLAAARALGCSPLALEIRRDCPDCGRPHGRPRLVDHPLEVSVSHAGDIVVVALSPFASLGVDVERIDEAVPGKLAGHVLGPDELPEFEREPQPGRAAVFFRSWTRKEAVLKATGDGLRLPMNAVTFDRVGQLSAYPGRPDLPGRTTVMDLAPEQGYRAALAVLTGLPLEVSQHDGRGLLHAQ